MTPTFYIVDVFGETRYSGNQLAVFVDCESLSSEEMLQIAREMNFSETTFIMSREKRNGGYDVRIFTPGSEVDFAGHPTLGTAYILLKHVVPRPMQNVILNLKVGQVPVEHNDNLLWMKQVEPKFGAVLPPERMMAVLNLPITDFDTRYPVEEVSTGLHTLIIPLKSLSVLKKVQVHRDEYDRLIEEIEAKSLLVFAPEGYNPAQTFSVRDFPLFYGIAEDPATGSSNGCFAAYLSKHKYLGSTDIDVRVGQGYEIGRPSTLYLKAHQEAGRIHVTVGGNVIPVATGEWGI